MNKLGIFVNFWEKSWTINYPYYIDKVARLGYDILEFQAQPLLEMSDEECRAIRRRADDAVGFAVGRGCAVSGSGAVFPYPH